MYAVFVFPSLLSYKRWLIDCSNVNVILLDLVFQFFFRSFIVIEINLDTGINPDIEINVSSGIDRRFNPISCYLANGRQNLKWSSKNSSLLKLVSVYTSEKYTADPQLKKVKRYFWLYELRNIYHLYKRSLLQCIILVII